MERSEDQEKSLLWDIDDYIAVSCKSFLCSVSPYEERGTRESEETDESPPRSSDWSEEWATKFLKLVLEHCRSGEMTGPDLTTEAWHSVLHRFEESVQSQLQIEHLKEELRYYEHRYRVITKMIENSSYKWDPDRRFLVQGDHHFKIKIDVSKITPYFDTLEELCLLLDSKRSSEQQHLVQVPEEQPASPSHDVSGVSKIKDTLLKPLKAIKSC